MNTNQSIKRTAFTRVFQKPQVTADVQPAAGGGWGADGYEEAVALDMRWREIDDWSAERSPRLAVRSSRLRQPNARLESTGLRPATQPRTLLGGISKSHADWDSHRRFPVLGRFACSMPVAS
jgi:hypothetical protein